MILTSEVLDQLIEEVLLEYQAEHCRGLPIRDKLECDRADQESRDGSADRRRKKEQYSAMDPELLRLGKGILEEEPIVPTQDEIYNNARIIKSQRDKIKKYEMVLNKLRRRISSQKITQDDLLKYCSRISDASSGKITKDVK